MHRTLVFDLRAKATASLAILAMVLLALIVAPALAEAPSAQVPVETVMLDNGMEILLVAKPELSTVYAGWVAHVGSANERPGITGISHFFEHMMFKGTHTVGTSDIERDLEIIAEQEAVQEKIRTQYRGQRERWRQGEIDDPFTDENRTEELVRLENRFRELVEAQRSVMVKDEFDKIYREAGASSMNAFTSHDMTGYFISLPANKLELWFWMESDRLQNPIFREFYSERDVVYEERRLRIESTPTGAFDEVLDSIFWHSHPYGWPVVGWPSDLEVLTKAQADEYFATYYSPNNLTGVLVGNFDRSKVEALAKLYFGRIPRGKTDPPDVVTLEMEQTAEKRMLAECDCQPQVEMRYHTVPVRHRDSYALDVLAALLNSPTGRLYKALVLDQKIASRASAGQDSRRWAGLFVLSGETRGDATPEQLEDSLEAVLKEIQEEPIPERELQKVKNRIAADSFRRLESPFFQLIQLILYEGAGDWKYINYRAEKTLAVTAEDVQRVAKEYFASENRTVGLYHRKAGTEEAEVPPELAELPDQARQAIQGQIQQIRGSEDPAMLETVLQQMETQKAQAPPEFQAVFPLLEREVRQRLEQLESAKTSEEEGES